MSIVSDVRRDLGELKTDRASLRKFGLTVGAAFLLLGAWITWHKHAIGLGAGLAVLGAVLGLFGAAAPALLKHVYLVWMGFALCLGWCVSRILLILLFFGIVTPLGLLAKLVGKRFLDLPKRGERQTMWIPRNPAKVSNYEKMY